MQLVVDFFKKFMIMGLTITFMFVIFSEMAFYITAKLEFDTEVMLAHSAAFTYATTDDNMHGNLGTIGKHDTMFKTVYWNEFCEQVDERLSATGTNKSDWFTKPKTKIEDTNAYGLARVVVTVSTDYVYQGNYMKKLHDGNFVPTIQLARKLEIDLDYRD